MTWFHFVFVFAFPAVLFCGSLEDRVRSGREMRRRRFWR